MAKSKLKRAERVVIGLLIAVLSIATIVVVGLILMNVNLMEDISGGNFQRTVVKEEIKTPFAINQKVVNFLVVGIADDPDDPENRELTNMTDTIMVVSFDIEKNLVNVLQIPRDSYVGQETPTGKINAIYKQDSAEWDYAGLEGLMAMIHEMFQINIDHYITLQMNGFSKMIDQIGGVTMNVPADMELNGTEVSAGMQTLDGKKAIAVVRTRNVYITQDLGRLDTQKVFLSALVDKCFSMGVANMTKLIPTMFSSVKTDLTLNEALGYYSLVEKLDMSTMAIMTAPGDSTMADGQSVYSVFPMRSTELMNTFFRPYSEKIAVDKLKIPQAMNEPYITAEEKQNVAYLKDLKDGKESSTANYNPEQNAHKQSVDAPTQNAPVQENNYVEPYVEPVQPKPESTWTETPNGNDENQTSTPASSTGGGNENPSQITSTDTSQENNSTVQSTAPNT